jgi:hypothetical protein
VDVVKKEVELDYYFNLLFDLCVKNKSKYTTQYMKKVPLQGIMMIHARQQKDYTGMSPLSFR